MSLPARPLPALAAAIAAAIAFASCAEPTAPTDTYPSPSRPPSGPTTEGTVSVPSPTPTLTPSATGYYGVTLPDPVPVEAFALTDQRGARFRVPRDLHGRVSLLYFGYTHCPDICPGTLAAIAVALRDLPEDVRDAVDVVFVTVDPARDTREVLGDYLGLFSEDFVGLTGSAAEIDAALARFGFEPPEVFDLGGGEYSVGHPAGVLAITPDDLVHVEYPFGTTVEMWQHDLTKLVREGWRRS